MVTNDWVEDGDEAVSGSGEAWHGPMGRPSPGLRPSRIEPVKVKKGS